MSSVTFAQFLYGEIGQESGGNYNARSPAGALGKYQILASNIPSWSREVLGYSITADQFMNPAMQDAIAIGMLWKLFQAYGPEGASSAWYTGNPNAWKSGGGGDSYGGPSAAGYVSSVMSRAAGYRGDGHELSYNKTSLANFHYAGQMVKPTATSQLSGNYTPTSGGSYSSGGGTVATSAAPVKLTEQDYKNALDSLAGLLTTVPELAGLMKQGLNDPHGQWTPQTFLQKVHQSKWWAQHNDAARQLIGFQLANPAEYQTRIANAQAQVRNLANQMGVQLSAQTLRGLATHFIIQGWDQPTLQNEVGRYFTGQGGLHGQAAAYTDQLKQLYGDYGLPVSNGSIGYSVRQLLEGATTLDTYKHAVINQAKSLYPSLQHSLDNGMTVKDIAAPYIQTMAGLLEIDPANLNLTDPTIKRALQGSVVTTNGKSTATSTPLYDFEKQVRSDPRWAKTQNATDTVSTALLHIGKDFGFGGFQ